MRILSDLTDRQLNDIDLNNNRGELKYEDYKLLIKEAKKRYESYDRSINDIQSKLQDNVAEYDKLNKEINKYIDSNNKFIPDSLIKNMDKNRRQKKALEKLLKPLKESRMNISQYKNRELHE